MTFPLVFVRGGGDLGSGVAHRLRVSGFRVVILDVAAPTLVRHTVSFATAIFTGSHEVEGLIARRVDPADDDAAIARTLAAGEIPVLVDPDALAMRRLRPAVVVDAILAKRPGSSRIADAPLVIALGPGHVAGRDAHAVIETHRGHRLGRVITSGAAAENTGTPGEIGGAAEERVLRAPASGVFRGAVRVGERVLCGAVVGRIDGHDVAARTDGILRGLLWDGVAVRAGMKLGDVDPRADAHAIREISDKSRAVAGGVLEAIFRFRENWMADFHSEEGES
ncbi:MAG: selenium-dependent molybdenum cofactor biosynthesis protein YqeB [bacterium]